MTPDGHGSGGGDEPAGSGGDVRASARGHAQQAVIGQGVQHHYFYGASGSARPGVVLSTLIPPPSLLVGGQDRPASLAAGLRAGIAPGRAALALLHGPGGAGKSAAAEPTAGTGPFDNPEHACRWLEAAAGELVGAAAGALSDGWELGGDFAVRTARLLYVQGRYERAGVLYEQVRGAAAEAGDERARGRAFTALGDLARSTGRHDEADALFGTAVETLGGVADTAGEADALRGLGESARARGDLDAASTHFTAALARARQADDDAGQGYALTGLAHIARRRGELDTAGSRFTEAAEFQRRADDGVGLAYAVRGLGHVRRAQRDLEAAERCFRDAMALHQRAGNRFGQAYALTALGGVTGEAGRFEEAAAHLDDALDLHRAAHDRTGQARAHAELAALARLRGGRGRGPSPRGHRRFAARAGRGHVAPRPAGASGAPGCLRPPRKAQVPARGPANGSSRESSSNGVPWWK